MYPEWIRVLVLSSFNVFPILERKNCILNYDACPNNFSDIVLCSIIDELNTCLNDFSVLLLCSVIVEPCITLSYVRMSSTF